MLYFSSLVGLFLTLALPASADTLVLANGDKISGEILEWAVDHVVIEHPQLGEVRLSLDQLELDTGTPPSAGLLGTNFLRGWSRRIDAGLTGKDGTSESTVITGGLRFHYDDGWTRWNLDGRNFYDRDEDGVSDNNARVDLRRDWLTPGSRTFWSLGSRYQFDETESWEHRMTFMGGPGYHLIRSEAHQLDTILGPAFTREFGDVQEDKAETSFILDYAWTISKRSSFRAFNNVFLELAPNGGDVRNLSRAEWSIDLETRPALSLTIGAENESLTDPEDGDENYNLKYYVTIGLDL
jgi:hypothetical protein